jgi:hypothetical protein
LRVFNRWLARRVRRPQSNQSQREGKPIDQRRGDNTRLEAAMARQARGLAIKANKIEMTEDWRETVHASIGGSTA